jgi:hypothetical protein
MPPGDFGARIANESISEGWAFVVVFGSDHATHRCPFRLGLFAAHFDTASGYTAWCTYVLYLTGNLRAISYRIMR